MTWDLCTSGAAIIKAGASANSTIVASGQALATWSDEVQGRICAECRKDWVSDYANLDTEIKHALGDVSSSMIGMLIAAYDTTGYLSREADTILNVNDDRVNKGLQILKEKQNQVFS